MRSTYLVQPQEWSLGAAMSLATLMIETQGSAVISAEDLAELLALRKPRPFGYEIQSPHVTMICECGEEQPAELFILTSWNPTTFTCEKCWFDE